MYIRTRNRKEVNMADSDVLRNILLKEISQLPEDYIQEILDFTEFVIEKRKKQQEGKNMKSNTHLWHEFIGGSEHGDLAQDIDKELYG